MRSVSQSSRVLSERQSVPLLSQGGGNNPPTSKQFRRGKKSPHGRKPANAVFHCTVKEHGDSPRRPSGNNQGAFRERPSPVRDHSSPFRERSAKPVRSTLHVGKKSDAGSVINIVSRRQALLSAVGPVAISLVKPAQASDFDPGFYSDWPYIQPSDILPYIFENSAQGDAGAVIAAFDAFGKYYPMYKCGDEKGQILERLVKQVQPKVVLELGSFLGYSAIRIARTLPPGAKIITIEAKKENAAVATQAIARAGYADRVQVLDGRLAADALPEVSRLLKGGSVDVIYLDHFKDCYLPDLKQMEAQGLLHANTMVVADNVVYPGAPGFLEYVDSSLGRYKTYLEPAKFEYDQKWKPDWVPQEDALSVSVFQFQLSNKEDC